MTTYNPEQRRLMYKSMRKIIDRCEQADAEILSRQDRPDGYSRGGDGSRGSGHGDPTYSVVVRILGGEAEGTLTQRYFGQLHMAARMLEEIDSNRAGLLPPVKQSFSEDEWCSSCLRLVLVDHKGRRRNLCSPVWRDGAKICGFCRDWIRDYGSKPDLETLRKHAEGKRIYREAKESA